MKRVYIKDFDMPGCCEDCLFELVHKDSFNRTILAECPLQWNGNTTDFRFVRRADWCPLREEGEEK